MGEAAVERLSIILRDEGRTVRHGRRGGRETKLKSYDVFAFGGHVGIVALEMATLERSTPGRTYVDARWQSPRWFFYVGLNRGRRSIECTTRKEAVNRLIKAANLARPSQEDG